MTNLRQAKNEKALEALRVAVTAYGGPSKLARDIGTSRSHVSNVMHGTRELGRETAAKLRSVLAIDPSVLLDLLVMDAEGESAAGPTP